ncbi:signal peptidase I [Natranaerovirga hydrolytica]|uniref:Signal peptidase I n=1 Tax=Natranaerovirga hydrolytica TaxID=680378 RepID=A0A4R1MDD6_9FIRM|nr:signal peptidase I [Natranaerovirga hydrolytica]TCK90528.1 signal peptidase I [Natranaerovirga hydrolytica]
MKRVLKEVVSWVLYIAGAFVLVLVINAFLIQPTQVQGSSMEGTLNDKDRIIINKLTPNFTQSYEHGEIVVIDSRVGHERKVTDELIFNVRNNLIAYKITGHQDDYYWIKRIIGVEGDVIEFTDTEVILNGEVLEESYLDRTARYNISETIVVPEGHVFVMGDNRNISEDSRRIGSVPIENIVGKYWIKIN